VLDGADPQRLLLLTFSRRAAAEMEQRAGRMLHRRSRARARRARVALVGHLPQRRRALLREYAPRIGSPERSRSTTAATPRT
jgi:DNA helicase-2/ATP-dependent DNA helicase PcrA